MTDSYVFMAASLAVYDKIKTQVLLLLHIVPLLSVLGRGRGIDAVKSKK